MSENDRPHAFLTLPTEILHRILDYLDASTILLSLSKVCRYFRAISNNYNRFQLDFRAVSKVEFHHMCRVIPCENVRSLTLSDDNKTPGEIALFFSLFQIDQFPRLHSLTLLDVDENDLCTILKSSLHLTTMKSLFVHWRESHCPTQQTLNLLSSMLNQRHLQRLELITRSYAIENMMLPLHCTLEHLSLMYVTQRYFCSILRQSPCLASLTLHHCSLHKVDDIPAGFEQLTSLALTDSRMTMAELKSLLSLTPSLTHLKIIGSPDSFDTIADGFRWEKLIETHLPVLHKFEFFFTNMYNVYYNLRDIQLIIGRFQTPFWTEVKSWFVSCDYIDYLNQILLYTIPLCTTDFTYECDAKKISLSTSPTLSISSVVTENVHTINLTLTKLMAGAATTKNLIRSHYVFQNVNKLTIDVDQDWSMECIEFLSTIIDLSRLDKLTFNPDFNHESIHATVNSIGLLMTLAFNLTTLAIHPYSSQGGTILMETLCSIIPSHIKYLEVTIKDVEQMRIILDHCRDLWTLTLLASSDRSILWTDFVDELTFRKVDFAYWESYYSVHIWFSCTRPLMGPSTTAK